MNKIVALVRVSTDKQDVNNQKFAIEKKYPGYDIAWFEEPGISGAKKFRNRPELQAAIRLAKKFDCPLVVYSLSRLGRTYEVGQFLEDNKGKIKLDVLDTPNLDDAIAGFHVAINRMERINISNRTKAALQRLKAEGKQLGNQTNLDVVRLRGHATIKANADKYAKDIYDIIQGIKLSGVHTLQGIADALNNRGVKTFKDRVWYPSTIKNVLERVGI
jgi:DNA invertase Pin-like site-specific DNA recombinase